jgi:hypothetical protein
MTRWMFYPTPQDWRYCSSALTYRIVVITHMAPALAWYLDKMNQMQTIFFSPFLVVTTL